MNNYQNTEQYGRNDKLWARAWSAGGVAALLAEGVTLSYFGIRDGLDKDLILASTFMVASPIQTLTTVITRGILEINDLYASARGHGRNGYLSESLNGLE